MSEYPHLPGIPSRAKILVETGEYPITLRNRRVYGKTVKAEFCENRTFKLENQEEFQGFFHIWLPKSEMA